MKGYRHVTYVYDKKVIIIMILGLILSLRIYTSIYPALLCIQSSLQRSPVGDGVSG